MKTQEIIFSKMVASKKNIPAKSIKYNNVLVEKEHQYNRANVNIAKMQQNMVNSSDIPVNAARDGLLGKIILFIRKLAKKLFLQSYLDPIVFRQNRFNQDVYYEILALREELDTCKKEIELLKKTIPDIGNAP